MDNKVFGLNEYDTYWKKRIKNNRIGWSEVHSIVVDAVKKYVPVGSKVLDLGVGPGHIFKELQKTYNCYGVEISDEAVKMYDFPTDKIIKHDFSLSIPDFDGAEKFDAIIASNVIHHMTDPAKLIKGIHDRLSSPNSIFVFVTPNISYFIHRISYALSGQFPNFSKSHKNFLSPSDFETMLKSEGFNIKEIKTMGRHKVLLKFWPYLFSGEIYFICSPK